jgi:hypothetical protein
MANQRPHISLTELSKKVAEDVGYNISCFVDQTKIAKAALGTVVRDDDDNERFRSSLDEVGKAVEEAIRDTCDDNEILSIVTTSLREAGITNDPPAAAEAPKVGDMNITETVAAAVRAATADLRPQPSMLSMDVTALREQILSSFIPHP